MERNTPGLTRLVVHHLRKRGIKPHEQDQPVFAYANHGRWVADCYVCNGAEHVKEGEQFLCGTCGALCDVVWPEDCTEIEQLLDERPKTARNWRPGEPVDALRVENDRRS